MIAKVVDPAVQALLDEAHRLPDCAARMALLERAACAAVALEDYDSAWSARCQVLSSEPLAPRFESLFVTLAWCLGMSDRDPKRFPASRVLWQYKWVVETAPSFASVPRAILERLVEDMDQRFVREGWGRRAGLQKRLWLFLELGDPERAKALLDEWRAVPRDAGADCCACEAATVVGLFVSLREDQQALQAAAQIIRGRLSCVSVPHSTFGVLLPSLLRLGRRDHAEELYEKGRRLVAGMENGGAPRAAHYLIYAAHMGHVEHAQAILRARFNEGASLQSDVDRLQWFGRASVALSALARSGLEEVQLYRVPRLVEGDSTCTKTLSQKCREIADLHALALDRRNGNAQRRVWLETLESEWRTLTHSPAL